MSDRIKTAEKLINGDYKLKRYKVIQRAQILDHNMVIFGRNQLNKSISFYDYI